jgi:hypothetical protein
LAEPFLRQSPQVATDRVLGDAELLRECSGYHGLTASQTISDLLATTKGESG